MPKVSKQSLIWRDQLLADLSREDAERIRQRLDELDLSEGWGAGNGYLMAVIERYKILNNISIMRPAVEAEADRIAELSGNHAALEWLRSVAKRLNYIDRLITDLNGAELADWAEQKSRRFEVDLTREAMQAGAVHARKYMAENLAIAGVEFDDWGNGDKVAAMAARMILPEWWIRNAKKQFRVVENVLRECGQVCKQGSPYVSSWSLNKFRKQQQSNRAFLESWEAVNQYNQSFTLAELSDRGISNPVNRRNELMTRIRGTEELATELNHDGLFITLTCPSKYHAVKINGKRNKKFDRANRPTVRDGQKYLCDTWARIRAFLKRNSLPVYGIRTVEPNHDGCPHWHMMLFCDKQHTKAVIDAFTLYGLMEDGNELGAKKQRVKVVRIDPAKGTASGYVAKYISKNIDGKHIDTDLETGKSGTEAAERITAWSRRHGIRQFQFFGGVSVTVWRELRRFSVENAPSLCTDIYHAANRGDWMAFTKLMGGVFAGRNQTLKPHYAEPEENQFGELVASIQGVARGAEVIVTRLFEWTVQKVGAQVLEDDEVIPWTRVNNCTGGANAPNQSPIYH